jgi:hypothetical protein
MIIIIIYVIIIIINVIINDCLSKRFNNWINVSKGVPFPKNFNSIEKTILKRLFRVYAHIYHQHFAEVVQLGEEAHLNTSFKHFIFFVQEFNLIDKRELAPLNELIDKLATNSHPHHSHHHSHQTPPESGHISSLPAR